MNVFYLPNDIFKSNLPPYEYKVFTYLIMRADRKSGFCFPSIPTIANDCGISETKARRAVQFLEEKGFIEIKPQFKNLQNGKIRQSSNMYKILLPV
ncbi:MAG: helix-turn-helix domain-containing protein [Oscillospiraceae bacterium]|nr:helix-turn-helix domain-containing protein [Oscillospiraceae bacterium]